MGVYEVTAKVLVEAGSETEARAAVLELLDDGSVLLAGEPRVRDTGADRLPPEGSPVSRETCVRDYRVDPWEVLAGEHFDVFVLERPNDESREAGLGSARGLLCVVWHVPAWSSAANPGGFGRPDARDEALERGSFCGGTWSRTAGRKAFFYVKG